MKLPDSWLVLIHQVPNSPPALRVKMWRRLQKIGAVSVKNSVYVLPHTDQSLEDFHWVAREIVEKGGEASICEATFVEGLTNKEIVDLFQTSRDSDYAQLLEEIQNVPHETESASDAIAKVSRLRQKFDEIEAIDFFPSGSGSKADSELLRMETRLRESPVRKTGVQVGSYSSRTWVTRKGIHIDRIASAWLIRKFIDRDARLKFVAQRGYRPESGELRFDMFDAEFTHQDGRCTFEVLLDRTLINDRGLRPIAEIIHDIDLKESKFNRPQTAGIALVIDAICTANKEDQDRLKRGSAVLDDLYEFFRRRQNP
jgi:hypothetical protein